MTDVNAAEKLARDFHAAYERLAPTFGYETRKDSAVPWEQVPEQNRRLMIAVAGTALRNGYARTWVEGRDSDEDFQPEPDTVLEDPDGNRWVYVDIPDGWVCSAEEETVFEWSAALMEAGSLREVIA